MKTSEKTLVKVLTQHFEKQGFNILQQVRIHPREIDLLLFDPLTIRIISVEVKRVNWRKAFSQAILNKLYSHFSLIAIRSDAAARIPSELLRENSIGLIEIGRNSGKYNFRLIEQAGISKETNRLFIRHLFNRFSDKYGEGCNEF